MVLSRHEYTRALAEVEKSKEEIRVSRTEWKRQENEQHDKINGGEDPLAKGKGKGDIGKGKGKGPDGPPTPTPPIASPPPIVGPPSITGPPGNAQLPPPPPPNASVQPPSPSVSSPQSATPPTETPSAPPPPPTVSTTTSVVISTSVAIDSSTSIQTSFITITQSTVLRQETVVTTATSVDYFPGFAETTTSGVPILPSTLSPTQSASTPTAAPLPPPGYSGPSEQATPLDPTISQVARNLLIALGVMGVVSLLIAGSIILTKRSKKRTFRRIISRQTSTRPTSKDNPYSGQGEKPLGVTTEITALPRGNSLQERENDAEANTQYRTVPTLVEEATTGTTSEQNKLSVHHRTQGRTFSDALHSFIDKARNSSYSYKVGP